MNSLPLVSIVLCAYNGEAFLKEQLFSLENQTYKNIEFICSDNDSTDKTSAILTQWCNENENRKFFSCKEKGLNKNFFSAVKYATGTYIIFCDQDDIWLETKVEELINFHEQNANASMVYCLSKPFTDKPPADLRIKNPINRIDGMDIRKTLFVSHTLGHNICIKKVNLDKIPVPENETVAFDWWITVSAMCLGNIKCLHKILTFWRQHKSNTSNRFNEGSYYENRIKYLRQFETNELINKDQKKWIQNAIGGFSELAEKKFSKKLFLFFIKNADIIFFYKTKKNPVLKWISFTKWALKLSRKNN
jgi:glycosyltransferase involved in cell wall biosynthesis